MMNRRSVLFCSGLGHEFFLAKSRALPWMKVAWTPHEYAVVFEFAKLGFILLWSTRRDFNSYVRLVNFMCCVELWHGGLWHGPHMNMVVLAKL